LLSRELTNWHVRSFFDNAQLTVDLALRWFEWVERGGNVMSSIFYIIGVVVVVLIILSFLGLR
jgi:small-conductance mechanosensitive channel